MGKPVTMDLRRLTSTSKLLTGFGPLGSEDLIAQAILAQNIDLTDSTHSSIRRDWL